MKIISKLVTVAILAVIVSNASVGAEVLCFVKLSLREE